MVMTLVHGRRAGPGGAVDEGRRLAYASAPFHTGGGSSSSAPEHGAARSCRDGSGPRGVLQEPENNPVETYPRGELQPKP